ncbi:spermatogenesis-associated protein 45 [Varanus komodoensis]|uniref:spermatogenesis-associated protein 45 n=1 Tax=Varanus komodoensis TaxID=61221 RepID=UPI001CF7688D|nr:spermatogenesis-associated protein 45 [Varanus komodoensis]
MAADEKRRLIEYNKMRETMCLLEGKSESTWLRPQRRHYPQSNRTSIENYQEQKHDSDSGRTSWVTILPTHHREKRHFPEKNNAIFG